MNDAGGPAISVVIPTYNRVERLKSVLDGLTKQTLDRSEFEVIVVSDGCTDATDDFLRSGPTLAVRHIEQENSGPAAARNHGLRLSVGRLVLFIDDDVVPSPRLLKTHLEAHGDSTSTVVIGPMLNAADFAYSPWVAWEQSMLYKQYAAMRDNRYPPTFRQFYTGNASAPRDLLVAAGGFDTTFRRAEDVELAYRLSELGATFVFDESAEAFHYAVRSYESWLATSSAYGANDIAFARDHGQTWLIPKMIDEFGARNLLTRFLVLSLLTHERPTHAVTRGLRHVALVGHKVSPRIGAAALSAVYGLNYYVGAATASGNPATFRRMLRGKVPPATF